MAQNHVCKGEVMQVLLAAAITSGKGIKVGTVIGVALNTGEIGDTVEVMINGVFTLPKAAGAMTQGALLYWDDTAKNITTTAASNAIAGIAYDAALTGDTVVNVKLQR